METTTTQSHDETAIATLQTRDRRSKQESEMGHQSQRSMVQQKGKIRKPRNTKIQKSRCECDCSCDYDNVVVVDDEKVGIEKRIMALQRIVPGGESLEIENLFDETADYIMALQEQVKAMKVIASFFEKLEKENRKFGG